MYKTQYSEVCLRYEESKFETLPYKLLLFITEQVIKLEDFKSPNFITCIGDFETLKSNTFTSTHPGDTKFYIPQRVVTSIWLLSIQS